jgi:hypothetical protein
MRTAQGSIQTPPLDDQEGPHCIQAGMDRGTSTPTQELADVYVDGVGGIADLRRQVGAFPDEVGPSLVRRRERIAIGVAQKHVVRLGYVGACEVAFHEPSIALSHIRVPGHACQCAVGCARRRLPGLSGRRVGPGGLRTLTGIGPVGDTQAAILRSRVLHSHRQLSPGSAIHVLPFLVPLPPVRPLHRVSNVGEEVAP